MSHRATHIISTYEYVAYATHLKRLSEDDRYCRFRSVTSDEAIEKYVKNIQNNPNEIVIAHYGDDCGIDGSLQLSIIENPVQEVRKKIAELSMSVLAESRGQASLEQPGCDTCRIRCDQKRIEHVQCQGDCGSRAASWNVLVQPANYFGGCLVR